jgi:queuine/archaeosine tRNA-ribosyltransferase
MLSSRSGRALILGNAYHLSRRPMHEAIRRMEGLRRFTSFPRL